MRVGGNDRKRAAVPDIDGSAGERGNDLSLRFLRDIFVLFAQMHHQGILDIPSLIEMFLGVAAVEDHRGISAATSGREKGHQSAEAIAHQADLATGAG